MSRKMIVVRALHEVAIQECNDLAWWRQQPYVAFAYDHVIHTTMQEVFLASQVAMRLGQAASPVSRQVMVKWDLINQKRAGETDTKVRP